ncbi:MAG: metallopeptidase family protein [Armatimonadota bacterium]
MSEEEFEELVMEALEGLPRQFKRYMQNVQVVVQPYPTREQLRAVRAASGHTLLGLYHGVPLTQRSTTTPPLMPDVITLFREPLLRFCATPEELREQVRHTVIHEIAHFFGISDDRLRELGAY